VRPGHKLRVTVRRTHPTLPIKTTLTMY